MKDKLCFISDLCDGLVVDRTIERKNMDGIYRFHQRCDSHVRPSSIDIELSQNRRRAKRRQIITVVAIHNAEKKGHPVIIGKSLKTYKGEKDYKEWKDFVNLPSRFASIVQNRIEIPANWTVFFCLHTAPLYVVDNSEWLKYCMFFYNVYIVESFRRTGNGIWRRPDRKATVLCRYGCNCQFAAHQSRPRQRFGQLYMSTSPLPTSLSESLHSQRLVWSVSLNN